MAGTTGLEPAASAVTGQRSNQLNYVPSLMIGLAGNPRNYYASLIIHLFRRSKDTGQNRDQRICPYAVYEIVTEE